MSTRALCCAIRKYGKDAFMVEEIFYPSSADEATRKEVEFIAQHKANNHLFGYNMTVGGDGVMLGRKHSEETRKKISASKTGKPSGRLGEKASNELCYKLSTSHLGIKPTIDALKKRTETRKLRGIRSPMLGKHHSDETRKKMVEAQSHRVWSDEQRAILAIRMREVRKLSPRGNKKVMGAGA